MLVNMLNYLHSYSYFGVWCAPLICKAATAHNNSDWAFLSECYSNILWQYPKNHFVHPLVSLKKLASISHNKFSNPQLCFDWSGLEWQKSQLFFVSLSLAVSQFCFYFCMCSSMQAFVYSISSIFILFVTLCSI